MEALLHAHVRPLLPLSVCGSEWSGELTHLNIHGTNWSFNTDSAWRILTTQGFLFGSDSPEAERIAELVGQRLVQVDVQSVHLPLDPALHFDNGWTLEVFSSQTYEPWVFRVPEITLVAPVV